MPSPVAPPVIEVEHLSKHFSVPGATPRGTLNRLIHPVQRGRRRTLRVLDGISFDVRRGELFGIVGRNGSGKTTLLRILGSIYRADAGRVRISGTLAPFIELGVGFQPEMSARQNVALNGVLLGLGRREVRRRVDEVLAWAELEDFEDVQLKNFSSGMRVRLAFASMLQADPDIYLIDEILAVGDEVFRQKCMEQFHALKQNGRTILMVTHRGNVTERQCDRALLLRDGRIAMLGDPQQVLDAYRGGRAGPAEREQARAWRATIDALDFEGANGSDPPRIASGVPLSLRIEALTTGWVQGPTLELTIRDEHGSTICVTRDFDHERLPRLKPGERLAAKLTVENSLGPGRYRLDCVLRHGAADRSGIVAPVRSLEFQVAGSPRHGLAAEHPTALYAESKLELVH